MNPALKEELKVALVALLFLNGLCATGFLWAALFKSLM
jgi:hypothetical protein